MIDGVFLECAGVTYKDWINNRHLNFFATINPETAELKNGNLTAVYKGLKFFIKPSSIQAGKYHFIIQGSLHKYRNNGKHNADSFTISDLKAVIQDLQTKFKINPDTTYLRGFEFGVNITPPIPVKEVLKSLVAYKGYNFSMLKIDGKQNGKQIKQQRHRAKIYDKAKQYDIKDKQLLRIEIAVKKMAFVKPLNIVTLQDLTDLNKVLQLKPVLLNFWNDVIFYDKKVRYKDMTNFEQKKLLYYASPRNWTDFNRLQRHRAKQHFNQLISKYGTTQNKALILYKIDTEFENLTAEKCKRINQLSKENDSPKMITFDPLKYSVKMLSFNKEIKSNIFLPKNPKNDPDFIAYLKSQKNTPRRCVVCGTDISHKRPHAQYCSKTCNNKLNGKRRTHRRQAQRQTEIANLTGILQNLNKSDLWLTIKYKQSGAIYGDLLHQSEIATDRQTIRQVYEIVINRQDNAPPVILTRQRAKQLIKALNDYNRNNRHTGTATGTKHTRPDERTGTPARQEQDTGTDKRTLTKNQKIK